MPADIHLHPAAVHTLDARGDVGVEALTVTLGQAFSADELAKLAADHGVDVKVAALVSEMIRIIECRRLNIKP